MVFNFLSDIPQSSLLVHKEYRLFNLIKCRIQALQKQIELLDGLGIKVVLEDYVKVCVNLRMMLSRLDNNSIICNSAVYLDVLSGFNKFPKTIRDHSMELFGHYVPRVSTSDSELRSIAHNIDVYCKRGMDVSDLRKLFVIEKRKYDLERNFLSDLKRRCLAARKIELLSRLRLEMTDAVQSGWYVIFNTLTIAPHHYKQVFSKDSSVWTDYVRSIDRAVGISIHGNWRKAIIARRAGDDFHRYFAVTEKGSQTGRLHIHVLHMMRKLPDGCYDPNRGSALPNKREVSFFKGFWNFGHSSPVAVRFDMSDAFGLLKWQWPVKRGITGQFEPLECRDPAAIVSYVGKYITKSHDDVDRHKEVFRWRTKISQSLGKKLLIQIVKNCNHNQLELVIRSRPGKLMQTSRGILPLALMKKLSMKELLSRYQKSSPQTLWTSMVALEGREGIITQLRRMIRGVLPSNTPSFGDIRTLDLVEMEGFNLHKLICDLEVQLFGVKKINYKLLGNSQIVR